MFDGQSDTYARNNETYQQTSHGRKATYLPPDLPFAALALEPMSLYS
jgi:hypothetical protein